MKLNIVVSKARDGKHDYVQIMSEDMFSVNVVFVVDSIKIEDHREKKEKQKVE